MGRIFELRKDNSGLKYLFKQPTLNARQTKWMELLSEYKFDINHIKGKENKVVDALNRGAQEMHATTIRTYKTNLKEKCLEVVTIEQHYVQVEGSLQQHNVQKKYKYYKLEEDGILFFKNKVYVSNSQELRNLILKEMHNVQYFGNPWYWKTITNVRVLWPKGDIYRVKCIWYDHKGGGIYGDKFTCNV